MCFCLSPPFPVLCSFIGFVHPLLRPCPSFFIPVCLCSFFPFLLPFVLHPVLSFGVSSYPHVLRNAVRSPCLSLSLPLFRHDCRSSFSFFRYVCRSFLVSVCISLLRTWCIPRVFATRPFFFAVIPLSSLSAVRSPVTCPFFFLPAWLVPFLSFRLPFFLTCFLSLWPSPLVCLYSCRSLVVPCPRASLFDFVLSVVVPVFLFCFSLSAGLSSFNPPPVVRCFVVPSLVSFVLSVVRSLSRPSFMYVCVPLLAFVMKSSSFLSLLIYIIVPVSRCCCLSLYLSIYFVPSSSMSL